MIDPLAIGAAPPSSTLQSAAFRRATRGATLWRAAALAIATLVAVPILVVAWQLTAATTGPVWTHLWQTTLPRVVANSAIVGGGVAIGTALIGTGAAWLVTAYDFPGRRPLSWALALPLAMPAYIVGYAWTDFMAFAGPAQTWLRLTFEWRRGEYWFPDIHGPLGAAAMLTLVLYPYVYLLVRTAFLEQAGALRGVARTLGCGPWAAFRRVALPLARPAIIGGATLAIMEALADFGTVQYFGVDTFTTAIFRTWFGMGDRTAAAQLAAVLMFAVLALILVETWSRRRTRFWRTSRTWRAAAPVRLTGGPGLVAAALCGLPVLVGFVAPVAMLIALAASGGDSARASRFMDYAWNTVTLGAAAAAITLTAALVIAYGRRLAPRPSTRLAARIATIGYAVPGAVVAVGVLIPLGHLDQGLNALLGAVGAGSVGLVVSGGIGALLYAYIVRFLAIAHETVSGGLGRITPHMDDAARVLGASPWGALRRVHLPMLRGVSATGLLIVFVDVVKELPATIIVRPFDFDTLAIRVYSLASDERLSQAATGALAIVLVGLVPVILLSRLVGRSGTAGADQRQ